MNFVEDDKSVLDDCKRVLCWPRTDDKTCAKDIKVGDIYWLYIDETYKKQVNDGKYTLLGVQFAEEAISPFELKEEVQSKIIELLNTEEYVLLRKQDGEDVNGWSLKKVVGLKNKFFEKLKENIKKD